MKPVCVLYPTQNTVNDIKINPSKITLMMNRLIN